MPNTYGLNVLSKKPFDPTTAPKTEGAFNSEVLNAARSTFDPQLTQIKQLQNSENLTYADRTQAINNIYRGYANQIGQNNTNTKNFVKGLQGSETNGTNNTAFDAAITGAGNNANNLANLGLSQGTTPQQLADYENAANTSAGMSKDELNSLAANLVASGYQTASTESGSQAQQLIDELNRHGIADQSIATSREGILNSIPSILENERNTLIGQLQSSQNVGVQEEIALKNANIKGNLAQGTLNYDAARGSAAKTSAEAALLRAEAAKNTSQYSIQKSLATLGLEQQKTSDARQQAALKYVTSWITPPTSAYTTNTFKAGGGISPTGAKLPSEQKTSKELSPTYKKNPAGLIAALEQIYGMNRDDALNLVANVNVPLEGGSGALTLGQWATMQLHPFQWANGVTPSPLTTTPPARLKPPATKKK